LSRPENPTHAIRGGEIYHCEFLKSVVVFDRILPFSPLRPEKGFFVSPSRLGVEAIKKPPVGAGGKYERHQISSSSVPFHSNYVNRRYQKTRYLGNPPSEALQSLWREFVGLADIVPEGQRPGLAMARTRLLDGVPSWRLPAILNALTGERALA